MKNSVLFLTGCVIFGILQTAEALPKFAIRVGAKCQSCHINPTGKGLRNTFGSTYGREELPMPTYKELTDIEDFSPALTENFTIGTDYRTLYYYQPNQKTSSFFQMQGDLYLDLRLNKKFRIYLDKGLYSGFEVFGLAKVLPLDGYIKVGHFIPAYGLKIDDHNAFIRGGQYNGGEFSSVWPGTPSDYPYGLRFGERAEDSGLEFGIAPSIFTFSVGIFDGLQKGDALSGSGALSTKVFVARGDALFVTDYVNVSIGGSFYNDPNPNKPGKTQFYGGFASASLLKNLTLLAETDIVTSFNTSLNKEVSGTMYYAELSYVLFHGLDLKLGYDAYDPDNNLKNGTFETITVGAEFFPLTGIELRPLYRFNREQPKEISNDEFQFLFHFYL